MARPQHDPAIPQHRVCASADRSRRGPQRRLLVAATALLVLLVTAPSAAAARYTFTGGFQYWTVPPLVTSVLVEATGAQGGNSSMSGGYGGRLRATLSVTAGESITVVVGGQGQSQQGSGRSAGGYNGGGSGGYYCCLGNVGGGGGGGATDLRRGSTKLLIAAGGGGSGGHGWNGDEGAVGGAGGGTSGSAGADGGNRSGYTSGRGFGGGAGTQSAGGAGATNSCSGCNGTAGGFGYGGEGGNSGGNYSGGAGGGGGGYYGGGGGSGAYSGGGGGGGGGGSSWTSGGGAIHTAGVQAGGGGVIISAYAPNAPSSLEQRDSAGVLIASGGSTTDGATTNIQLRFQMTDGDTAEYLKPWVEVRPESTAFSASCGQSVSGATFTAAAISAPSSNGAVTANVTVTGLSVGTAYHWRACATDQLGRPGAWTAMGAAVDFRVVPPDSIAPTITDNQAGDLTWRTSNSGSYDVDFGDNSALARFETRVWSAAGQTGTLRQDWTQVATISGTSHTTNWGLASSTWTGLQEGTNYVTVRVFDASGNGTTLADAFTVRKDTVVPPAVSTLASPSPVKGSRVLSWSTVADATSGTSYYRVYRSASSGTLGSQINANGATTAGTYTDSTTLADGTYYYTVQAVDVAGLVNGGTGNNQVAVVLSTSLPTVTDNQPGDATWRGTDNGSYDVDFSDDLGLSRFETRVWSAAGQTGTLRQEWTLVSALSGTAHTTNWSLAPSTWAALPDGTSYVSVRLTDTAGNQRVAADVFEVRKDTTAPAIVDNQTGDMAWRSSNSGVYDVDFTDVAALGRFETRVWSAAGQTGTLVQDWTQAATISGTSHTTNWGLASSTWTALQEGTNHVTVRLFDAAGNTSSLVDAFTVRKDTVVPPAVSTLASPSPVNGSRVLSWSAVADTTSGTSYYRVYRSASSGTLGSQINAIGATTSGSYTDTAALADGTYYYTVRAVDAAGLVNGGTGNNQVAVVLSTSLPTVTDNQPGDATWRGTDNGSYDVDFSDDLGLSRFETRVWSAAGQTGTLRQEWTLVSALSGTASATNWALAPSTWATLPDGTSYVSVRLTDSAGNQRVAPDVFEVRKDTAAPAIVDSQPGDTTWRSSNSGAYDVDFSDAAELAAFETRTRTGAGETGTLVQDWTPVATLSGPAHIDDWSLLESTWRDLPEGTSYVSVRVRDGAGNETTSGDAFTVRKDTVVPPAVTSLETPSRATGDRLLSWSPVVDETSGTAFYRVYRSSSADTLGSQINVDGETTDASYVDTDDPQNGTYHYTVRAVDAAGLENTGSGNARGKVLLALPSRIVITSPLSGDLVTETPTIVTGHIAAGVADQSLSVNGVEVRPEADGSFRARVVLTSSPATIAAVAVDRNGRTRSTSVTVSFRGITFYGFGGSVIGNELSNVLLDWEGDSQIFCGSGGNDVVRAGAGDDTLDCAEPYRLARTASDDVDCGSGFDVVHVDIFDSVAECERVTRVWMGAAPRDSFTGSAGADWFVGLGGDDRITCRGGSDQVSAGSGDDLVRCSDPHRSARRARDTIECGAGKRDRAYVDVHDRTVGCEIVVYELVGTDGLDQLRGSARNEMIYALRGNDPIACGGGRDVAYGGIGDDTISCADAVPSRSNRDVVECGVGPRDRAIVDRYDVVRGCEIVVRR